MKKFILLLVMLVPLIVLSQGQQPTANNIGLKSPQGQGQYEPSGTRSVPPGILVWSQLPICDGNYFACQESLGGDFIFNAKVADDFLFTASPGQITAVRWWVGWFNGGYVAPTSFNIIIYLDNNCLPGGIVGTWNIAFADAHEGPTLPCIDPVSREYWAELDPPFVPVPGQHYWIVTQPVEFCFPQTGVITSMPINLCPARQDFPLLGIYWETIDYDMAFELYASQEVPVANWALLVGGILIAGAIFFRYRRSS